VQQKIVQALELGNYREIAFRFGGIADRTGFEWCKRGRDDREAHRTTIWTEFLQAVEEAEARAEMVALGFVRQAMSGDWKAAAWYLERKHRDRFGRTSAEDRSAGSPDEYAERVQDFLESTQWTVPPVPEVMPEETSA
jgi:hypothetical protein